MTIHATKIRALIQAAKAYLWEAETQHTISSDTDWSYYRKRLDVLADKLRQALKDVESGVE